MLNKLVQNRFLTIPVFDQRAPDPDDAFPAGFVEAPNRIYSIQESVGSGLFYRTRTSHVVAGAHAGKAHRTFRWLPWVPGKVSCVPLAGPDILTGRMSGCWLVVFRFNNIRYAGHIGTEQDSTHDNTTQVKAAWRNAVKANQIVPVSAVNPVAPASLPANIPLNLKGEAPEFFAAFDANGHIYAVVLTSPGKASGALRRIAKVIDLQTQQDVTDF